ncbi:T9SS type A sorting domain-containing protein [Ekhidna sp.]|uniref:T9SS type A sorting domain-containing protein n=1 Tax=Ekhidna sp. TaxID=2608089 RepID=UPI003298B509
MSRFLIVFFISLLHLTLLGQTTTQNGQWTTNGTWIGSSYPGTLTVNAGDDDLDLNNQTISIDHYVIVGASDDRIDMNFANSNSTGSLTIENNDTLIVYGDWVFANKSMDLNIGSNSVVIVLGDASFSNKIDIATSGTLVVLGNFNKSGSQGSYSGGGAVYAGSYSGSADSFIPGDTGTGGDQQQTIDDLSDDGFTEIEVFVDDEGSTPLPVELIYFNVNANDNIELMWATASEINNDHFVIQRSEDGITFYEIGKIGGNGDSNEAISYVFTDRSPTALVHYYRLKQVDFDGQFEYLEVKRVATGIKENAIQIKVFPTVVKNAILNYSSNQPIVIREIALVSLSGGEAYNLQGRVERTNALSYSIDVSGIQKGFYLIKIITAENQNMSSRIIIK